MSAFQPNNLIPSSSVMETPLLDNLLSCPQPSIATGDASLFSKMIQGDRFDFRRLITWPVWRNLIIYFCLFSVVGHWMEACYGTLIRLGVLPGIYDPSSQIWSNLLYPFWVYGFGAVVCVLLLFPVKNFLRRKFRGMVMPLILSFLVNMVVCSGIELMLGLMLNQPSADGALPLWDYRDMFGNFMGQICLQTALCFGLVATLFTWSAYPRFERLFGRVPDGVMAIVRPTVGAVFCILLLLG